MAIRVTEAASASVSVLCRADDQLGEGPLWDHRSGELLWLDILRGTVHMWSEGYGLRDLIRMEGPIGCVALAGTSDLLLATPQGIVRWTASGEPLDVLGNPIAGQPVRFNDGRVDAAGRFWVGTMALDAKRCAEPLGALYRFDPDGGVHCLEEGLTISNGLDWSPDGQTFYLTDTMRRSIYAYDFDEAAGTLSNRRVFVSTDPALGYPDGLVVDRHGHLWSASFAGSVICRYDPAGRLVEKLTMPVSCPTAMTFGGPDLAAAFVTTSQHALQPGHPESDAGSLLTFRMPGCGRKAAVFGERHAL